MNNIKSLLFLASREVYYACYRIIEHCVYSAFWYCLCDEYQGCLREDCMLRYGSATSGADYCCVCRTFRHYKLEELEKIKHGSFRLERFYLNLLRDLVEILEVDPTACFWEDEIYYKYGDYREGTESQSCLRDHIDFSFERVDDD